MAGFPAPALAGIERINGFLAQELLHLLERCLFLAAEKQQRVTVADNGIRVILVDRLELGLRLEDNTGGNLTAADGGDQLFKVGDLPDVGKLVNQAADMHRQAASVHIIRHFAEQIEHLRVRHADEEVEAGIRVRHDEEQGCPFFPDGVQVKLIVGCDLPELFDIEHREACAAADQDALRRLA